MSTSPLSPLILSLRLSLSESAQSQLLEGLDVWLRLGLLTDQQVRQICHAYLSCPYRRRSPIGASPAPSLTPARSERPDFADAVSPRSRRLTPQAGDRSHPSRSRSPEGTPSSSGVGRSLQAFMAEISVAWLLFLGVFLVVVSSGVLAATQWRAVSPIGQYSILFTYTLAFFGSSLWSARQATLRLTSRMLQITTLLIIPVNIWMMDSLKLGSTALGWVGQGLATIALFAMMMVLLRPSRRSVVTPEPAPANAVSADRLSPWIGLNFIALSGLHWGWGWAGMPLLAVYVGTIGTAGLLVWQRRSLQSSTRSTTRAGERSSSPPESSSHLSLSIVLVLMLSVLLLINRALWLANVPLGELGLAVGICGWLLSEQTRRERLRALWQGIGLLLLLVGWAISVGLTPPWQAIGVSGLGLWLLWDWLRTTGRPTALLLGFLVSLQVYGLLWRVLPPDLRQGFIQWASQSLGANGLPESLLGLAGFPLVWLLLIGAQRLRSPQSRFPNAAPLALYADRLALITGGALVGVSLSNPGMRALTLTASALTLGVTLWQRSRPSTRQAIGATTGELPREPSPSSALEGRSVATALIYLTHLTGLAAICAWIDWFLPSLSQTTWAMILLGLMAVEWLGSLGNTHARWRQSAWYIGIGLASLSYVLFLSTVIAQALSPGAVPSLAASPLQPASFLQGLARDWPFLSWSVTPVLLTGLTYHRQCHRSRAMAIGSIIALIVQFSLLRTWDGWLLGLALGTGLMLLNTIRLPYPGIAGVTIGFALGLEATLIGRQWGSQLDGYDWLLIGAGTLGALWLLWSGARRRVTEGWRCYQQAANGWAMGLCGGLWLLILGAIVALTLSPATLPDGRLLGAAGIIAAAVLYRLWQQPTNLGFYGLAWGIEILVLTLTVWFDLTATSLGLITVGLGWVSQMLGDGWVQVHGRRSRPESFRSAEPGSAEPVSAPLPPNAAPPGRTYWASWHGVPLFYAGLGLWFAHGQLTPWTSLSTLVAALTVIGVGRRSPQFQGLTLFGAVLVSAAAYEWLIDGLLRSPGGEPGDGLVLLAGLGTALAIVIRGGRRWWRSYLRVGARELAGLAHGHWALGSGLAVLALLADTSSFGAILLVITAIALTTYALLIGRQLTGRDGWIYIGILQGVMTLSYGLYEAVSDRTALLAWAGAIAAVVSLMLDQIPWRQGGWSPTPGRRSAGVLPILIVCLTSGGIALQSLGLVAAFYAWYAKTVGQIRYSYLSLVLGDWALVRLLQQWHWLNELWWSAIVAGSILYVVQVDPFLQSPSARQQRHWLRSIASGFVCLTAFYQAEVETGATVWLVGLLTLGLCLGFILAGLGLRIRAFLYVGTIAFLYRMLRWLWLFIDTYPVLLWAVGILLGLGFIWVAATFEARRSQVNTLVNYWATELDGWE